MAELAIGLQRPVCSIVEIGKFRVVMLTDFTACVGRLSACPSAIGWPVGLIGCLGIGLVALALGGYLPLLRLALPLDHYLL